MRACTVTSKATGQVFLFGATATMLDSKHILRVEANNYREDGEKTQGKIKSCATEVWHASIGVKKDVHLSMFENSLGYTEENRTPYD